MADFTDEDARAMRQIIEELKQEARENAELSKALEEIESRDKELSIMEENLKAQIEKMKMCCNCVFSCFMGTNYMECYKKNGNVEYSGKCEEWEPEK